MSLPLLILLCAVTLVMIADRVQRKRPYEMPFLMGATFVAIGIPQLVGMYRNPTSIVPPGAIEKTLLMSILSLVMLEVGWRRGLANVARVNQRSYNLRRLTEATFALGAIGAVGAWLITKLPAELTSASGWSGLPVAYLFFALALSYGYALGILQWLKYRTIAVAPVIAVGTLSFLGVIIYGGRREPTAELLLIPGILLWLVRRTCPPRIILIPAIIVMAVLESSVGDYRAVSDSFSVRTGLERTPRHSSDR